MRMNHALIPTLREVPAEAVITSHKLLLQAGFIRRTAAGMYTYLPLAQRVLQKIEKIIREEMDACDGQEILMPITQPAELWQESGRWEAYGEEMFRLNDRHDRPFCLGPTHEEVVTDLVRREINSYKALPLRLYQIQNKYRDERRPRFGLMRGREFIMKDLYSFDIDEAGLDKSYWDMYHAYERVFSRVGLQFRAVLADSGQIGGGFTHEFMVLAENGEATIVYTDESDYCANLEVAPAPKAEVIRHATSDDLEKIDTPDCKTIEEVSEFLSLPATSMIKTLVFQADDELIVVLVRGDREVNEVKVSQIHPTDAELTLGSEEDIVEFFKAHPGSLGPVGLKDIKIYADLELEGANNLVCGANEDDKHYIGVDLARDAEITAYADLRMVLEGELSPDGYPMKMAQGIEVGQVFKLGKRYSEAMGATFLDENGRKQVIEMGCYGIGVSRTLAAAVEQNNDENGIIWPKSIAPYHVYLVLANHKNDEQKELAENLYQMLQEKGIEVLYDDRKERAGVKFNDADLIGIPLRLTVGKKAASGIIEWKERHEKDFKEVAKDDVVNMVLDWLAE